MLERRFSRAEFRADSGTVRGVALKYGDEADLPGGVRERFEPGAFGDLKREPITADVMHDPKKLIGRDGANMALEDSPADLRAAIELPDTTDGRDAREMLRLGILTGFSVEFRAEQERFEEGPARVIERARLFAVSLVDVPAYDESVAELRGRAAAALEQRGRALARLLRETIGNDAAAPARLAESAGIAESTMRGILSGEIQYPPRRRLAAFAGELGIPIQRLISAVIADGASPALYQRGRFL